MKLSACLLKRFAMLLYDSYICVVMEKLKPTNYHRVENTIYIILWSILFVIPLAVQGYDCVAGKTVTFEIDKLINSWLEILPFFMLFWIHNLLLLPLLFRKGRKWLYAVLTVCAIAGMTAIVCGTHTHRRPHKFHNTEMIKDAPPSDKGDQIARQHQRRGHRKPPGRFNMFLITNIIFALFTVSTNIAIRLYFRGQINRRRIQCLEAENAASQLQYLKYQINPHFFMNTLNNIHALIDIDAVRAQAAVVELSKMMRYVLYDINRETVTLRQEVTFLKNYIELMKIRLTDNVKIKVDFPTSDADVILPPLLFIPFVENIFKHGISHKYPSIIEISLRIDGNKLIFSSQNSNHARHDTADSSHGIGLENLRRRLDLLYGSDYSLTINASDTMFVTCLTIPLYEEDKMHSC